MDEHVRVKDDAFDARLCHDKQRALGQGNGGRIHNPQLLSILIDLLPLVAIHWRSHLTGFQEGVSPTAVYTTDVTYIRSGSDANNNLNGDPDQEVILGFSGTEMRVPPHWDQQRGG